MRDDYPCEIVPAVGGNRAIAELVERSQPALATRIGGTEIRIANYYRRWRRRVPLRDSLGPPYPPSSVLNLRINAGFFPPDSRSLDRFAETYLDALREADILGVFNHPDEGLLIRRYCPSATLTELVAFDSMVYPEPWTAKLAGRRVLVVHPFARSIERQYRERRPLLFSDPSVLPAFELLTLEAVQSIAGTPTAFASWFDALRHMEDAIARLEFDVSIIGAGAYGLPLGAFIKRQGRVAIHLGGITQMLFGIVGRRWEVEYDDRYRRLVNEWWIRPLPDETPGAASAVENGCYW